MCPNIKKIFKITFILQMEEKTRADTQKFREDVEKKINSFIKDEKSAKLEFPVMEKFQVSKSWRVSNECTFVHMNTIFGLIEREKIDPFQRKGLPDISQ